MEEKVEEESKLLTLLKGKLDSESIKRLGRRFEPSVWYRHTKKGTIPLPMHALVYAEALDTPLTDFYASIGVNPSEPYKRKVQGDE